MGVQFQDLMEMYLHELVLLFTGIDGLAGSGPVRAGVCIPDRKGALVWEGAEIICELVFLDWVMHGHY